MRRIAILVFLWLAALTLRAQIQYPYILNPPTVAPSGSCAGPQIQVLGSNGAIYSCNNGTWAIASGGGTGTVTSVTGTTNQIDVATGTTTPVISIDAAFVATAATNIAGGSIGTLPYQSAASTTAFLAANTAATDQVLVSHGSGSAGLAPTLSNAPALSAANMTSFPAAGIATATSCGTDWTLPNPGASINSNGSAFSANLTSIFSFNMPCSITFNKISYDVTTADNSANLYDLGIYSATGSTLMCHAGATAGTTLFPGTGSHTATMTGNCVLVGGGTRYIVAFTAATATAKMASAGNGSILQVAAATGGATSGGALNSTATIAADNNVVGLALPFWTFHN